MHVNHAPSSSKFIQILPTLTNESNYYFPMFPNIYCVFTLINLSLGFIGLLSLTPQIFVVSIRLSQLPTYCAEHDTERH